ncbi:MULTISPECIES: flagellar hook-basal body complex protein FliE [Alteromonadaceae]|jgi:flagellar hook-basal body complex protein FliE|uniref:Flagellar hook-basal body complex protein FliE n=1 Tax=Brumicola blandensis TaxID=3075611 RepID=A0AAW8R432_9ALTE|nr:MULTISPECIES: flagellar hook-basal body complex protein FliE [unclassified Alteromonas]MDT0582835.1 flagellar hook-basal body complex protein FliE [Alteromonas sp. W409]MDT0628251.1 flagellar hook-basal body complex protein FliE [Alteromonas sp. W364]
MDIKANSIYQEMQAMMGDIKPIQSPIQSGMPAGLGNTSGAQFSDMLSQAVNNVNDMQATSREMQKSFDMGNPDLSLADVMIAKEKAGIAFEATMQVRNKVLEAYKTIMNMPV